MKIPGHLLVFRFSALGDVAMTVPVIKSLLQQYPHLKITFVSSAFVTPLFAGIERLQFHAADVKGKYKGVKGLFRLSRELTRLYGNLQYFAGKSDCIFGWSSICDFIYAFRANIYL